MELNLGNVTRLPAHLIREIVLLEEPTECSKYLSIEVSGDMKLQSIISCRRAQMLFLESSCVSLVGHLQDWTWITNIVLSVQDRSSTLTNKWSAPPDWRAFQEGSHLTTKCQLIRFNKLISSLSPFLSKSNIFLQKVNFFNLSSTDVNSWLVTFGFQLYNVIPGYRKPSTESMEPSYELVRTQIKTQEWDSTKVVTHLSQLSS